MHNIFIIIIRTQEQDQDETEESDGHRIDDWMLICQHNAEFGQATGEEEDCDWSLAARAYTELREMPSYIAQQRQEFVAQSALTTTAHASHLQGKQLQAYTAVRDHSESSDPNRPPLRMVVSGTAGTGKSYLIQCLKLLLKVAAPTGVAAFNVDGYTLHSLLSLPVKGDFKPLEGKRLQTIQQTLAAVDYIIIDEMSMVGRKMFGQVDRRLRQVFPERSEELFGGRSCLLTGDWGQLPPVMDLPLYTTVSRTELSDLGSIDYHLFNRAVVLDRVMRQAGQDAGQERFRNLLLRLRNAELTVEDWKYLMTRTTGEVGDTKSFDDALRLYPTIEAVAEHNVAKLRASGQPIAVLRAVHTGPGASKATSDDAGGLEPVICIAHGARVMLSANLWVEVGLVNGALGTVEAICYEGDQRPPNLPIAVTVKFDSYSGPTLPDGTVPITPLRRTWFSTTKPCSRLQIPLKLAWAVTIHKSQGLTLDKAVIDIGKKEFSTGLTFVACSRVRQLTNLLFVPPFSFQRVANLSKSVRLKDRLIEDARLQQMSVVATEGSSTQSLQQQMSVVATEGSSTLSLQRQCQQPPQCQLPPQPQPLSQQVVPATPFSPIPLPSLSPPPRPLYSPSLPPQPLPPPPSPLPSPSLSPPPPPSPPPPTTPPLHLPPSPSLSIDGLEMLESSQTYECPYKYHPVDNQWQRMTCENMGLIYIQSNDITPGGLHVSLTVPASIRSIRGDGNCFFRSLSYIITGSEEQHESVRLAIVRHMRAFGHLLHLHHDNRSIDEYIHISKMDESSTWATQVEMFALTHLLGICLYVYSEHFGRWNKYDPCILDSMITDGNLCNMGIYVNHPTNHFEVVTSISLV